MPRRQTESVFIQDMEMDFIKFRKAINDLVKAFDKKTYEFLKSDPETHKDLWDLFYEEVENVLFAELSGFGFGES